MSHVVHVFVLVESSEEKSSKLISANLFQKVTIKTFNYLLLLVYICIPVSFLSVIV